MACCCPSRGSYRDFHCSVQFHEISSTRKSRKGVCSACRGRWAVLRISVLTFALLDGVGSYDCLSSKPLDSTAFLDFVRWAKGTGRQ